MSGSHGELFGEIGTLVLAAHAGQAIDLAAKSEELTQRYETLGVSQEIIAKIIARSIGAISFTMARVSLGEEPANGEADAAFRMNGAAHDTVADGPEAPVSASPAKTLFPSGVRLSVLS